MKNNYFYCREKNIPVTRWCTAALRCRSHWEDLETFPSTCSAVPGNGSAGKFAAQQAAVGLLIKYSFRMALYILGLQSHHSNVHEYRGYVCFCKAGTKSETKHAISFFSRIFLLFFPPFNLLPPHHTHTYLRSLEWKKKPKFLLKRCQLWSSRGFSSHLLRCGLWALKLHVQKNSVIREDTNQQLLP